MYVSFSLSLFILIDEKMPFYIHIVVRNCIFSSVINKIHFDEIEKYDYHVHDYLGGSREKKAFLMYLYTYSCIFA